VEYALENDGLPLLEQDIKNIIEEDRAKRETLRMQITQAGWRRALGQYGDQLGKAYRPLVRDTVSFAKGVGLFSVVDGRVKCLTAARRLFNKIEEPQEFEKQLMLLILTSKYKAYLCFLANLQRLGGRLNIPPKFKKRTVISGIREFLQANRFATDVASFFTIRDLLYDFGLLNWRILPDDSAQEIYLTSELVESGSQPSESFINKIELDKCRLFFTKSVKPAFFADCVEKHYLALTDNNFGAIADLLQLRDLVCEELKMSDGQFNKMLLNMSREAEYGLDVELSQGRIPFRRSSGLLIKAINVIEVNHETFATYIRLRR